MTAVGCRTQSVDARGRFVEDGVSLEAHAEWTGERIDIDNAGVTPSGGLSVIADSGRSRVRAVARLVSLADSSDKPSADDAIRSAKLGFTITTSFEVAASLTAVHCGHGNSVGSARSDDSGCDALDVLLPQGVPADPEKPEQVEKLLFITARSALGRVGVSLGQAVLGGLEIHGNRGAIDVSAPATRGAVITIVAGTGDDIVLRLPLDFAADLVTLDTGGAVDTVAFPDVVSGKGRGQPGRGAKSITVRSARIGSSGRIVLLAQ